MPTRSHDLALIHSPAYTHFMSDAAPTLDVTPQTETQHNAYVRRLPVGMTPVRSPEAARELARARWDKAEHVARRKLTEAGGGSTWAGGWGEVVAAQVGVALAGGKGSHGAARFVMQAAGLLRDRADQVQPSASADVNDLTLMLTAFRRWRDAHPADAAALAQLAAAGGDVPGRAAPDSDE